MNCRLPAFFMVVKPELSAGLIVRIVRIFIFIMKIKKLLPLASLVLFLSACDDVNVGGNTGYVDDPTDPREMYEIAKEYFSGMNLAFDREKAVELFTKSAQEEYPQAEYMLACLYLEGNSVDKDLQKAKLYYMKAADHGITEAAIKLSETLYKKNGLDVARSDAIDFLKMAARSDPRSMTYLAKLYLYGDGVEQNYKKAEALLQKASSYKEPESLLILSELYFTGAPGILQDNYKGLNYLKIAANDPDNSDKSKVNMALGKVYLYGRGYPVDEEKAMNYFTESGEAGYVDAQVFLGNRYWSQEDYKRALYWYAKAAAQDHVSSQLKVGEIYKDGLAGTKNESEAISWYEKALANGSEQARYHLVYLYAETGNNPDKFSELIAQIEEKAKGGDLNEATKLFYLYAGSSKLHNSEKAREYLQQIVDSGNLELLENIGENLLKGGNNIQQNTGYALTILNYVAVQGEHSARIKLGDIYKNGEFTDKDLMKSYAWYSLAMTKDSKSEVDGKIKALRFNRKELKKANEFTNRFKNEINEQSKQKFNVLKDDSENTAEQPSGGEDQKSAAEGK